MLLPSKEQYIDVIRNGDDSIHKKVVLHTNGKFEVVANSAFDMDSDYVGRSETLDAGNGYVGIAASNDSEYINDSFAMFLKAWVSYVKFGTKKRYLDVYPHESEEEILKELEEN